MTTSRQRKASNAKFVVPACGEHLESVVLWTGRQCERQGEPTGRRMTNDCKHRKGEPAAITVRAGVFGVGEPLFDGRSLLLMAKQVGTSSHRPDGVKGGGMLGRLSGGNWGGPRRFLPLGGITRRIRHGAESARGGRGWASESVIVVWMCADNRTATERRAGRLSTRSAPRGGRV